MCAGHATRGDASCDAAPRQWLVDAHFRSGATSWRDVYLRNDLSGQIHRQRQSAALALVDKLRLPPHARVLEAGCGTGRLSVALARRGFLVTAIDTVPEMLSMARVAAIEAGLDSQINLVQSDVHNTGFFAKQFDLALAIGVIPWSEHPERAICELARVVQPARYVILSADNLWSLHHVLDPFCFPPLRPLRWKLSQTLRRWMIRPASPLRYRYYSAHKFDAILLDAGLEKIEGVTVGFGPFSLFNRKVLSDSVGLKVNGKLQVLADRGFPVIRSTGVEYLVSSRKAARLMKAED